jgi:hypothetical protein
MRAGANALDYFFLSPYLTGTVKVCEILGYGTQRQGLFCGSDHCASILVLNTGGENDDEDEACRQVFSIDFIADVDLRVGVFLNHLVAVLSLLTESIEIFQQEWFHQFRCFVMGTMSDSVKSHHALNHRFPDQGFNAASRGPRVSLAVADPYRFGYWTVAVPEVAPHCTRAYQRQLDWLPP